MAGEFLKVYIETTIVSYLTARPSRDLIVAAHQQITNDWWENRRSDFDLYTSQFVIRESGAGDGEPATKRLDKLDGIPLLAVSREALDLVRRFKTSDFLQFLISCNLLLFRIKCYL